MGSEAASSLSAAECRDLRRAAGLMIPASAEFGVPGADDQPIYDDILRSLGRDLPQVRAALAELNEIAGGQFGDLDDDAAEAAVQALHKKASAASVVFGRVILSCYYRDDRVLVSLGVEPRPPFPKGHVVEQGDWSLLDKVKARAPFWRDPGDA